MPDAEEQQALNAWLQAMPPVIHELAQRFPPWNLYRLKHTGQLVALTSYNEDGTVNVAVTRDFNLVLLQREVIHQSVDELELVCEDKDVDRHRLAYEPEDRAFLDAAEYALKVSIEEWHQDPKAPPPGPARAEFIRSRMQAYEIEALKRLGN